MINKRVSCIFVKVWSHLIYARGGRADGLSERYDILRNKWDPIINDPFPLISYNVLGINVFEKFVYLIVSNNNISLLINRLDIALQEKEISTLTGNQQP